jgi:outer membrane protein assembly factor BamE
MRVTQALLQSKLQRFNRRLPLWGAAACVALAVSGCASNGIPPADAPFSTAKEEKGALPDQATGAQTTTITKFQKFMWFFSPYHPDIQQGNFISEEMVAQLKTGMTRDQVRFVLGTPLLQDVFHADRWDYPFRLAKGDGEITTSHVIVYFKDGKMERFEGGNLPNEREYIARIAGPVRKFQKDEAKAATEQPPAQSAPLPAGTDNAAPAPVPVTPTVTNKDKE